ncbi:hypothetical protein CBR_g21199 [Chara braunii]|uniref:Myb-like domain-containing protein n=1 Tax=Chara braunii TaxID=69332 RepID=A0A388L0Y7_CHABU|nr:hypothetical protein CBR_g21199 [Chara braunii]|eukprot:GBG75957.1 hypothetical protein CBR_g21199 [Chara braunii]
MEGRRFTSELMGEYDNTMDSDRSGVEDIAGTQMDRGGGPRRSSPGGRMENVVMADHTERQSHVPANAYPQPQTMHAQVQGAVPARLSEGGFMHAGGGERTAFAVEGWHGETTAMQFGDEAVAFSTPSRSGGPAGNVTGKRTADNAVGEGSVMRGDVGRSAEDTASGQKKQRARRAPRAEGGKKNNPWTLEERIALARNCAEDYALMADTNGVHKHKTRAKRYEWIADRLKEEGYNRTAEDCRKKWTKLKEIVSQIRDKCYRSGEAGYFNMTTEQRREKDVCTTFEEPLWDAMEWWRLKKSYTCDATLASEDLAGGGGSGSGRSGGGSDGGEGGGGNLSGQGQGGTGPGLAGGGSRSGEIGGGIKIGEGGIGGGSTRGGGVASDGGGTDASDMSGRPCRTSLGRVRGDAPTSSSLTKTAMEDSAKTLCKGLNKASRTLACATCEGATMMSTKIGNVAVQVGAVAGAMHEGNAVLQSLVAVIAARSSNSTLGRGENDPS